MALLGEESGGTQTRLEETTQKAKRGQCPASHVASLGERIKSQKHLTLRWLLLLQLFLFKSQFLGTHSCRRNDDSF